MKNIIELKMPTDFTYEQLAHKVKSVVGNKAEFEIIMQSLDGRSRSDIHWLIRVRIGNNFEDDKLEIPKSTKKKKIAVVGYGPAGFFASYVLALSGFEVHTFERGPEVHQRIKDVKEFEKTGNLNEKSNYAFGEGGAGTFSDGKLTSRTKSIVKERRFIFEEYVKSGAPEEILYLSKPHIGSNLLVKTVKNLRKKYTDIGGKIYFDTDVLKLNLQGDKITSIESTAGIIDIDYVIFATGHSSINSYKMLLDVGAKFIVKTFAIGSRVEHLQETVNLAKWSKKELAGVKAADYALTYNEAELPVYSFCMCPGGMVVPAPPSKGVNLVNGMSNYKRNYPFANSAIVAAFNLEEYYNKKFDTIEALEWVSNLEEKFYNFANGYDAPAIKVKDLLAGNKTTIFPKSSYPFNLVTGDFEYLFPDKVLNSMKKALTNFSVKIRNWDEGVLMGLESRTSSPVQVLRNENGKINGIDNLYFAGEGSGFSGGIVSSGADGIKSAMDIINREL